MKIYFANAEKSSHRSLLQASGVTRYAINLTHFPIPKKKELDLSVMFQGGEVALYTSESDEDVTRYDTFLRQHYESLSMVIGRPDYDGAWLNERYIPVWNDADDLERLAYLCQRHGRVAISDKAITGKTISRIRNLVARWDAKLVGLSSKPDIIEALPWDSVLVGSWTSAVRYGETQVWDGHALRRYPAQQKDSARKKHRPDMLRLGIDYDLIAQDESSEVARLAIVSWQTWEKATFGVYEPPVDTDEEEFGLLENDDNSNYLPTTPTSSNAVSGGSSIAIRGGEKRHDEDKVLLPVIGVEKVIPQMAKNLTDAGEEFTLDEEAVPVIQYQSGLLRQCNSCYLSARCPAFRENAECGFKLPVEIKTKDQLQAALRALLEMQVSRVLFARFAEELEGQGLDPALSAEVERLFNLVEKFKDISDTRDMVRLEVEARGGAGVLSRIFGAQVAEQTKQLSGGGLNPAQTDRMYQDVLDLSEDA
jgi:hypothetical protein